ncbi:hypothetical protein C7S18_16665 [Ahniella affigens]|uniref:DUF2069 domain-containing protein n=1 Tax=Ahniella affigens TaxID=2021234 RepID=A0A2P1PV49_9GAMM|nr:DUF2069 domain-containing protein [Ahniella affigens]AVP98719.1 hypothetical protein C7S18_16665 [Ahniella affigens]
MTLSRKHQAALTCFLVLLVWQALWHLWLAPHPARPLMQAWLLAWAPLLLPGLLSFVGQRGFLLGMGFAAMLYFCHAVMCLWPSGEVWAWPAAFLSAAVVVLLGGRQQAAT